MALEVMTSFRGMAAENARVQRGAAFHGGAQTTDPVTVYGRIGGTTGERVGAQSRDVSPLGNPRLRSLRLARLLHENCNRHALLRLASCDTRPIRGTNG